MIHDRIVAWLVLFVLTVSLSIGLSRTINSTELPEYSWHLPEWTPRPIVPENNPMTAAKVELGRHLFYETRLSITGDYSCATCHKQSLAFTDGKPLAVGATGELHPRNSMALGNVAYSPILTWANPLMTDLEKQALVPMFGEHPVEMGMVGREQEILAWIEQDSKYRRLFTQAFPETKPFNLGNLIKAIASFERSLVTFNSPYDRYRYEQETDAISAAAKRGEKLFNSERMECFHCHSGINFSDSIRHENLAFTESAFHNTGLYNVDGQGSYPPANIGLKEISHKSEDMGRFKVPSLRNVALTAPYMHDGSVATLRDAISHYQAGGRTISEGENQGIGRNNPYKSGFIKGFDITESEIADLIAFLESLTDQDFITTPVYAEPK